ncbi:MAG: HD domain-containing protein, partial [Myxococcales bacterium]|nr:HD domain-containing protein [Myxococcales bacterium]
VQHDVYHVYTVDVHSVAAVDRLHELARGDLKSDHPLPCRLAAEMPRPKTLFLALLLHDIGKAFGRDHSVKGAEMAGPIAARLGFSEADQRHVVWLVEEHLSLYHWATRRDTSDTDTLAEIASRVGTAERLRDLYLLTFADLSTTNPGAMTAWKARMFEDLYHRLVAVLEGKRAVDAHEDRVATLRSQARDALELEPDGAALVNFLASMPDRYVLAHPPEVIRAHARLALGRAEAPLLVDGAIQSDGETLVLTVVTNDRPGLLADVAGVLAAERLTVVSADIYSRARDGLPDEAFDLLVVRKPGSNLAEGGDVAGRVQKNLAAVWGGKSTVAELLGRLRKTPTWAMRKTPDVRTEVVVDNAVSRHFTVVDVFTKDRLGLLYDIARALHAEGLSIALSKISTEGHRAADVFYVRDERGAKIEDGERLASLSERLRAMLVTAEQSEKQTGGGA